MTASLPVVAGIALAMTMACGSDKIGVRDRDLGTTLTVTVAADPKATPLRSWSLSCDPAGGTHPDPAAACAALARVTDPFAPTPANRACTDIYGGPAVARVSGTYRGQPVDTRFTRTDGCEIARWDALGDAVFGPVPAQPAPPA